MSAPDDHPPPPRSSRDVLRLVHSDRERARPVRRVWEKFEFYRNWALVQPPAPVEGPTPHRSRPKRD
jgi:hypothetical protein